MKLSTKLLLALFALGIVLSFITMFKIQQLNAEYSKDIYKGNQNWINLDLPVQAFNSIEIGNHLTVNWHKGAPKATIRIEENLKNIVQLKQTGEHVKIYFDSLSNYRLNGKIVVDLYSESLSKIHLKDFLEFTTVDKLDASKLELELEDHIEATMNLSVDTLWVSMYDFCELTLSGQAAFGNVQLSGHSQLDGSNLNLNAIETQMDDFTEAELNLKRYIKASLKDHAQLNYKGDSVMAEIKTRDFSKVNSEE